MVVLKKLSMLQENSEMQFNYIREKIHEHMSSFTKEMEIIKNNQTNSGAEEFNEGGEEYCREHL